MGRRTSDRDHDRLLLALGASSYARLLQHSRESLNCLSQFESWAEVVSFMCDRQSPVERKDEVLRWILTALADSRDPRWQAPLLAFMWPALRAIQIRRRLWDPDPEELWQNILACYCHVVRTIDVNRRSERIALKLYNDTGRRLYDRYGGLWKRLRQEMPTDPETLDRVQGPGEAVVLARLEQRERQEGALARIRGHVVAGRISEQDCYLIIATRLCGTSLADYARASGISYETAKKRRQRAEAVLRRFETTRGQV